MSETKWVKGWCDTVTLWHCDTDVTLWRGDVTLHSLWEAWVKRLPSGRGQLWLELASPDLDWPKADTVNIQQNAWEQVFNLKKINYYRLAIWSNQSSEAIALDGGSLVCKVHLVFCLWRNFCPTRRNWCEKNFCGKLNQFDSLLKSNLYWQGDLKQVIIISSTAQCSSGDGEKFIQTDI